MFKKNEFYEFNKKELNFKELENNKIYLKQLDEKLKSITIFYKKDKNYIKVYGHINDSFNYDENNNYKIKIKDLNSYIINKLKDYQGYFNKGCYLWVLKELKIFELINMIWNLGKSNIDFDDFFISVYQNISLCYFYLNEYFLSQKYSEKNIFMIKKLYNDGKKIVFEQKYGIKYDIFKIKINKILIKNSLYLINLLNIQNKIEDSINVSVSLINYCYKIILSQHYVSYYMLIKLEKEKSIREINKNKIGKSYYYSLKDYDYKTKIFEKIANNNICKNIVNYNFHRKNKIKKNKDIKISVLNKYELDYYNFLVEIIPILDLYLKKLNFIEEFLKKKTKDKRIKYYRQLLQEVVFDKPNLNNIFSSYDKEKINIPIEDFYKMEYIIDLNTAFDEINIEKLFTEINNNIILENLIYLSLSLYNYGLVLLKKEVIIFDKKFTEIKYSNLFFN